MCGFLSIELKMAESGKFSLADFNVMTIFSFASSFKQHRRLATALSVFGHCVFSVFGLEIFLSTAATQSPCRDPQPPGESD